MILPFHAALVHHAVTLVGEVLSREEFPADRILERHFRAHPALGSRERAWIADLVYQVLRWGGLLQRRAGGWEAAALVAACLMDRLGWEAGAVGDVLGEGVVSALITPETPPTLAEEHGWPEWLWRELVASWGEEAAALAMALNQPAPLVLRVNRLKATPEGVCAQLVAEGIPVVALPGFAEALLVERRVHLESHPLFRQGAVEIQDGASQRVAPALDPRPGETVVDLCAGAGGKTLHLAALMGNRGRIWAVDVAAERLARLMPRLKRAGVGCVRTLAVRHERDGKLGFLVGKADRVLVDAPCSGTGTLRRHPEIKWRLTSQQVGMLQERQAALLEAGCGLVRPGGRLVYATCSVLGRENREVVEGVLGRRGDFSWMSDQVCAPHRQSCDGFFIAVLTRKRS